ncbi:thioesterase family protein [Plebeiibacterium sediminum]|uniref:Thioesterase family protein n=1 Tax=Plebeiibacterium sediminum TaxID=2992112 RepID=A0AAE3M392_9BACT|nr:thioesterase family protein [Plebeiobacterium sediminum]MCW3786005.1 thioesterase family protein [Plebeiobacterium sediminum]
MMNIPVGLKADKEINVETKDTAKVLGSGGLDVYGTPAMIALMENVAMTMIATYLPEGGDSVGIKMNADHMKASPVGAKIKCEATIAEVDGRKVSYEIVCTDETGATIGKASHDRFVVDVERFLSKL